MDEFEWEQLFRESDRKTDRLMKLWEQFRGDPDCDQKIAQAMGWDLPEADLENPVEPLADWKPEPNDFSKDEAEAEVVEFKHHPLTQKAMALGIAVHRYIDRVEGLGEDEAAWREFEFLIQMAGAKLAGGLDSIQDDFSLEAGFIVACLKRSLNYVHQALHALNQLEVEKFGLGTWKQQANFALFELRTEILELMTEYRSK